MKKSTYLIISIILISITSICFISGIAELAALGIIFGIISFICFVNGLETPVSKQIPENNSHPRDCAGRHYWID
jgi:membrane-bound ClpP family serine protease